MEQNFVACYQCPNSGTSKKGKAKKQKSAQTLNNFRYKDSFQLQPNTIPN